MSFYCSDTARYNEFAGSNLLVVRIDSRPDSVLFVVACRKQHKLIQGKFCYLCHAFADR